MNPSSERSFMESIGLGYLRLVVNMLVASGMAAA
jgi:hypothetical protein